MPRMTNRDKLIQQVSLRLLIDAKALPLAYNAPWADIENAFSITATRIDDPAIDVTGLDAKSALPLLKKKRAQVFSKSNELTLFKSEFGQWLHHHFSLSTIAYHILFVVQLIHSEKQLAGIADSLGDLNDHKCIELLATIIGCNPADVANELQLNRPLFKYKLLRSRNVNCDFTNRIRAGDIVETHLFNPFYNADTLLSTYLTKVEEPMLDMTSFRRLNRDVQWLSSLLSEYKKLPRRGCNILLYGEPGTGKTQLSRVLAQTNELNCLEVNFASRMGEQLSGEERLSKLAMAQHFVDKQSLIVFDELEDAIPIGSIFDSYEGPQKRWFNELLEKNPVPIIWISNAVEHLDPAFLRRFDYCLKVSHPSTRYKKQILKGLLEIKEEQSWVDKVAQHKQISAADIERAAYVVMASNVTSDRQKAHYFKNILQSRGSSLTTINRKNKQGEYVSETEFSTAFSNTNIPLDQITNIVKRSEEGRFLLHGIPGTGKTGYVNYLANAVNKPLVSKSASDLLGMFVGENEKAIRNMFAEATKKNAILLLDEADSFFSDRANHSSDWRTSMVNEMLVQLERFQGVFFASTNLPDKLDKAITRRFDFSVSFTYLTKTQIRDMINSMLPADKSVSDNELLHLHNITPADFSIAARQARLKGEVISIETLLPLLIEQSQSREQPKSHIGFV